MTGVPEILVYPMTSGIANVASVKPATTSVGICDLFSGRRPLNIDDLRCGILLAKFSQV